MRSRSFTNIGDGFQNISDSKINNGAHAGDNNINYSIRNKGHGRVIINTVNFHIERMKGREGIHERKVRGYQGWRGRGDITSFFFSNFPDNYHEKDMWRVFKNWGRIREVFIARKKNKGGHRFGFVRFQGVQNVHDLEKQLDNVIIEGKKVYVNLPRWMLIDPQKISAPEHIVQYISLRINEDVHHIRVFEEVSVPCQRCTCCTWNFSESSLEASDNQTQ